VVVKERPSANRSRDTDRAREAEREKIYKEKEAEKQKGRDEALERCRERQRERERDRERQEKERKEKEEEKRQKPRSDTSSKQKDYDRDLPSLLSLKADHPHSDESHRKSDKRSVVSQSNKPHDRKIPESSSRSREPTRRVENRMGGHDSRRRANDLSTGRGMHDEYDVRRNQEQEGEYSEDRRGAAVGRKLTRPPFTREEETNWNTNQEREYKNESEVREEWNMGSEHHREWTTR
jgi:hypothetical protein